LKIALIDKEQERKGVARQVATIIANMAVYRSNPRNKKFRDGQIHFVREEPKSIFNYWWKSLQSGIKSSIMVQNNAQ
jgi:hypothetical protein